MNELNLRKLSTSLAVLLAGAVPAFWLAASAPSANAQLASTIGRTRIFTLPYVITEPGSYVVMASMTGVSGSHGILIQANDVDLDLNGFVLTGPTGSLDGIHVAGSNVVVRNGAVASWDGDGIDATPDAPGGSISGLLVRDNKGAGIAVNRSWSVTGCHAAGNQGDGIRSTRGNRIVDCVAVSNSGYGIQSGQQSLVKDTMARFNTLDGIFADDGIVESCLASGNTGTGIRADNSLVRGCLSLHNAGPDVCLTATTTDANHVGTTCP